MGVLIFPGFLAVGNFWKNLWSNATTEGQGSDEEFVRWFQQGREEGFNRLVQRHQHWVYNLCFRILSNAEDAEEAAQETFMRMHRSLKKFRAESQFSTWTYRIAVNASLNLRQKAHRKEENNSLDFDTLQETLEADTDNPEDEMLRKRQEAWIQKGIHNLPEEFRIAVILRDLEGREYEEIAEITKTNIGTVRSRLHRGRERLRTFLSESPL